MRREPHDTQWLTAAAGKAEDTDACALNTLHVTWFSLRPKEECMRPVLTLWVGLAAWWPTLAWAEGAGGGYRGIGSIYYTFIWVVLCYGLYDAFGKTVM